jgi:hypothetical protein
MKAILEFDLNNQDDIMAHQRCIKSLDMALALWHIQTKLRKEIEEEKILDDKEGELLDTIFDKINETYEIRGVNLDDLVE